MTSMSFYFNVKNRFNQYLWKLFSSLKNIPLDIQLKIQLSHQSAKIYTLEQKIEKLQARNKQLEEKVMYFKKKEKLRSTNSASRTEAGKQNVFKIDIYIFISIHINSEH